MLVNQLLEDSRQRQPEAVALIDGQRAATYAELDTLANRFANALIAAGIGRHDRVIVALDNSIEMVAAYFGTLKAGAVAVPLPEGPRSDRLGKAIVDCRPAAAVVDAATAATADIAPLLAGCTTVFIAGYARGAGQQPGPPRLLAEVLRDETSEEKPAVGVIDSDLAAIIYTSGSTGEPRGVMLTHRNLVANAQSIISYLELTARDRVMCVLPFHYVYGLSLLHTHMAAGGSVVIDNRFAFPNVVLKAMEQHEVTGFAGVPSTFALLLHRSDVRDRRLSSLRYVTQAGGAMPRARILEWLAQGPKVPFFVMYGATEAAARLTYLPPPELPRKLGSIGRAIPNVEILIVDADGRPVPPGQVGELVARGSNISPGYWNAPEETGVRFDALGYHTGDLGYEDDEGFLYLVGRRHDMIKVGANRVGAKEIEDVLHDHAAVYEAAVVGAPHDLLGEVPIAFVALRDELADAEGALQVLCASRLATHKVPARFILCAELPKLPGSGKIDRPRLRDQAATIAAGVAPLTRAHQS